jgi:pseudouridine synthase
MTSGDLEKWRKGVYLDDRLIKPKDVKILSDKWCVIEIYEGKKREIRRMAECLGYKVVELVRIKIGRLELKTLDEGCFLKFSKDKLLKMICNGGVV